MIKYGIKASILDRPWRFVFGMPCKRRSGAESVLDAQFHQFDFL